MSEVLIIDDDEAVCQALLSVVERLGHGGSCAHTVGEGLRKVQKSSFDIVFCDVMMPDGSGLDILTDIQGSPAEPEVIIITGYGDPQGAETAIKKGAWDYIEKPLSIQDISLSVERALQYREKKRAARQPIVLDRKGIIGESLPLRRCLEALAQAAGSDANILLLGETGTGKELFASAIHRNGRRNGGNFVVVDCAALPETLVESILFGHDRGAFTGAEKAREGMIKQADGGTLFLDEIGELPLTIQRAFLRALQEKKFRPVGSSREVSSDFRLIAATNRDLETLVAKAEFRADLLFRLRTCVIDLPPLRMIREDVRELVPFYLRRLCSQYTQPMKGYSPEFMDLLHGYDWPGNVRELIQALEKAIVASQDEPILFPKHLPPHIRIHKLRASLGHKTGEPAAAAVEADLPKDLPSLDEVRNHGLGKIEAEYLRKLIQKADGKIPEACRISGLSRSRLYTLLRKYGIST
jgi:two-component system NtrC family response regulator